MSEFDFGNITSIFYFYEEANKEKEEVEEKTHQEDGEEEPNKNTEL